MKRKEGFTLIELLIVIAIIALLMGILVPALSKAKEQARRLVCSNDTRQVGLGVTAYSSDTDLLPFYGGWDASWQHPFNVTGDKSSPADEGHPYAAFRGDKDPWMGPPGGSPYAMKLGCLYKQKYVADAKVFYCPSNRNPTYRYESYIQPLPPNTSGEWGTLPQVYNQRAGINQWVRIGLSYYPIDETMKSAPLLVPAGDYMVPKYTARRFSLLSKKWPYLTDGLWSKEGLSHKTGTYTDSEGIVQVKNAGVNALFKDGHAQYVKDKAVTYKTRQGAVKNERLFDNVFWDTWADPPEDIDARFLFYNIYKMIEP